MIADVEKRIEDLERRVKELESRDVKVKVKRTESEFSKFVKREYEKLKNSSEYASYQGKDRYMAIRTVCAKKWNAMKEAKA